MNDNAYKVELPGDYGVSSTFNVSDLSPFFDEFEELPSLRANSSQEGENIVESPTSLVKDTSLVNLVPLSMFELKGRDVVDSIKSLYHVISF